MPEVMAAEGDTLLWDAAEVLTRENGQSSSGTG